MRLSNHRWILAGLLLAIAVAMPHGADDSLGAHTEARGVDSILINFDEHPPGTVIDVQYPEVDFVTEPGAEIQTASVPFAPSPPNIICTVPVAGGDTCVADVQLFFADPVAGLRFEVIGAKEIGVVAAVKVFLSSAPEEPVIVEIFNPVPGGTIPVLVNLSEFVGVTSIEVFDVSDPAGIGYDNFFFELTTGLIFRDGFESGDTSAWNLPPPPVAPAILRVDSPPEVDGDYPAGDAAFGAPLDPLGVSGFLRYVDDGDDENGEGSVHDACQPVQYLPPDAIALIDLGPCEFATQVLHVQEAGAKGAVVVNTLGDGIFTMPTGTDGQLVYISSILVGQSTGEVVKSKLLLGVDVTLLPSGGGGGGRDATGGAIDE